MKPICKSELDHYTSKDLKSLAVQQSEQICMASKTIESLEHQIEYLLRKSKSEDQLFVAAELKKLQSLHFGRSSEKRPRDKNEGDIFSSNEDKPNSQEKAKDKKPSESKNKKGKGNSSKRSADAKVADHIEREDHLHRCEESAIREQSLTEWKGQFETSELIAVKPTQIIVQVHKRQKYLTPDGSIVTAPGPLKLREGSRYSIDFCVSTGVNKYQYHLPIERQVKMLKNQGLEVTSQTLFNQVEYISWLLEGSFMKHLNKDISQSRVNEADDTTWGRFTKSSPKSNEKYYLWGVKNQRSIVYNVFNSRSQRVAKSFLSHLQGFLITDAHNAFNVLESKNLVLAADWCHVRRRFIWAESDFADETRVFLDLIGELFNIEHELKGKSLEEIALARQRRSAKIIEAIEFNLHNCVHLPSSSLGKAISYALGIWDRLLVFLSHPEVQISTNGIERAMRGPAVGRKNHFGSNNLRTAKSAAVWYSLTETCKLNGTNTRAYLIYVIKSILMKASYQMPWEWREPESTAAKL